MKILLTSSLVLALLVEPIKAPAQPSSQNPNVAELPCAIVILIVGGIVAYKLVNFCQKHLPPSNPPPPPPTPPPQPTNSAPNIRSNVAQEPSPPVLPPLILTNDICCDISGCGWYDPSNSEYTTMFSYTIQSSTNLIQWQNECSVTGWVSDTTIVTELYTNGVSQSTNWDFNWQQQTNVLALPFVPATAPNKFFRLSL
jgi:hypothetical protein